MFPSGFGLRCMGWSLSEEHTLGDIPRFLAEHSCHAGDRETAPLLVLGGRNPNRNPKSLRPCQEEEGGC